MAEFGEDDFEVARPQFSGYLPQRFEFRVFTLDRRRDALPKKLGVDDIADNQIAVMKKMMDPLSIKAALADRKKP